MAKYPKTLARSEASGASPRVAEVTLTVATRLGPLAAEVARTRSVTTAKSASPVGGRSTEVAVIRTSSPSSISSRTSYVLLATPPQATVPPSSAQVSRTAPTPSAVFTKAQSSRTVSSGSRGTERRLCTHCSAGSSSTTGSTGGGTVR